MVLQELGGQISSALRRMSDATVIDKTVIDGCIKDICTSLLQADVNVKLVGELRKNIRNAIDADEDKAGVNKRRTIERTVFKELVNMLDPGKKPFTPEKGTTSVVMFVGLQGAGKTTSVAKCVAVFSCLHLCRSVERKPGFMLR
jgi:signal recognition particle subunit SRP54